MTIFNGPIFDDVYQAAGVAGFLFYATSYTLLSLNKLSNACISYFVMNLCASSLVMFSVLGAFNLATMMIQGFWILISSVAIITRLAHRNRRASMTFEQLRAASNT